MLCKQVKLKKGSTWECVADAPRDPFTGERRQIKRRGRTQGIAKERVKEAIRLLKEDGIDERRSASTTFGQIAEEWFSVYEVSGVKLSTLDIRRKSINILNRYIENTPIPNVTFSVYQKIIRDLAKDYSRNTLDSVNACANMIFDYAIKDKLIKDNPRDGVTIPKKRMTIADIEADSIEEKYMEGDELSEFLDAVMDEGLELDKEMFFTLAFSGMRPGELISLQEPDLNLTADQLKIIKTMYNKNNNMRTYELTVPKTAGSVRTIDMYPSIMKMLKQRVHKNNVHKMKYMKLMDDFHDEKFVFQRKNGYPYVVKFVGERMERLLKFTSIKKHLTPHSFRHTHISLLTEAGVDLPTIMDRVGHDDSDTTIKIYTHVTNKMKEKAVQKVTTHYDSLLSKITN